MSVQLMVTLLALVSLSTAINPECKILVRPRQDMSATHGKWVFHVGTWDHPSMSDGLKTVISSWIDISPTSSIGDRTIYWADRLTDGKCYQGSASSTVIGSTSFSTFDVHGQISHHELKYFESCPDCLLTQDTTLLSDGVTLGRHLFLFTRTGKIEASQLETFKRQSQCLRFLTEYHFTNTDLCTDDRETAAQ